ncbi:DUF5316 domain-containing protein [Piscibacillus salipiscarius]|uniref:DUF5316 domain-containing protein n=1 Tax=Piscibacillus salipiscarius TaxID=299480 RepID=A0ABW5Q9X9_9BACI|nr:DUF5316 domain-containing protein [Piscibacillus salipiscarius]
MNKALFYGLVMSLIAIVAGLVTTSLDLTFLVSGVCGVGALLFSGMLTGAFVSGDRNRANYHASTNESKQDRHNLMVNALWFSLPNIVTAAATLGIYLSFN